MMFENFPYPDDKPSFLDSQDVLDYLKKYAEGLPIKYNHTVKQVIVDELGIVSSFLYDIVFVCNGHYFDPYIPLDYSRFKGVTLHSHDYRRASDYRGQNVLIIGAGPSGIDIALQLADQNVQVTLMSRNAKYKDIPSNITQIAEQITEIVEDGAITKSGMRIGSIDTIIFGTGYNIKFPFLSSNIVDIKVNNQMISPLYEHVVHIRYPTSLYFIGICHLAITFPLFEIQVRMSLSFALQKKALPPQHELESFEMKWWIFAFPHGKNAGYDKLGDDFAKLHVDTRLQVSHAKPLESVDPVVVPIYQTTTYRFRTVGQWAEPNHRCGNPTTENVEVIINELEQGQGTLLYSSGLAAGTAVFMEFLEAGAHLICLIPVYSSTFSFLMDTMKKFGVEITFIDVDAEADNCTVAVEKAMKPNTKLVFCEMVGNPTMSVPDILETMAVAHKHKDNVISNCVMRSLFIVSQACHNPTQGYERGKEESAATKALYLIDTTFASPYLVQPIKFEADLVKSVTYPGLESHPGHKYTKQLMKKFSGMVAFNVGTVENAAKVVQSIRVIEHAISLGGTESLMEHPLSMSHGKQLISKGWPGTIHEGMIRFSVGIENVEDLIADLD
ncbi:hypothetical protein WR25_09204 [Diploscapter pachys]|uniref:Flavin-containing monooxygenase n=1 Tax=Diploscapter pachys TaxID=2018661 RepID=A0A2A2LZ60_9BILA|nr:hypothetical protein WR25_09204 [Diploscapter pachys]